MEPRCEAVLRCSLTHNTREDKRTAIVVRCCTEGEHANGQGLWSSSRRWHSLHHKTHICFSSWGVGPSITNKQCCCLGVILQVSIAWYSKFAAMVWSMIIWPLITISYFTRNIPLQTTDGSRILWVFDLIPFIITETSHSTLTAVGYCSKQTYNY